MSQLDYFVRRKAELEIKKAERLAQLHEINGGIAEMEYAIAQIGNEVDQSANEASQSGSASGMPPEIHLSNYDLHAAPE